MFNAIANIVNNNRWCDNQIGFRPRSILEHFILDRNRTLQV